MGGARKAKLGLFVLMIVVASALTWGVVIEPRIIDQVHLEATVPRLPEQWERKGIALFTDMQVGMWLDNENTARRIVRRIIDARPAAVLIGGDFVYHPAEDDGISEALEEYEQEDAAETEALIRQVVDILRPLTDAGLPVYAVLGNHDYAMETRQSLSLPWVAQRLTAALEGIGIQVLQNESVVLGDKGVGGRPLHLVGIGSFYSGEHDVDKAFAGLRPDAARIVLLHNPQPFERIPAGQAPLALAGHTHGGQIRIPFLPAWSWISIVKEGEVHADGWIADFGQAGNRLYVNRGIGFSRVPIRINCAPELTCVTLTSE
jgi:hypothetical protein